MLISALSVHFVQFFDVVHEFYSLLAHNLQLLVQLESPSRVIMPIVLRHIQFRIPKIFEVYVLII